MAKEKQVFLDMDSGVELVMPVYAQTGHGWIHGINVETIHLDQMGDLAIPTTKKLCAQPLEFLLPAKRYPFCTPGAETNPYYYLEQLEKRCDGKSVQRYIVTGTPINAQVIIRSVDYTEPDGTGDLTCTVQIQEYRAPEAIPAETSETQVGAARAVGNVPEVRTYTVVKGDCLWSIARRFYGDGSLCYRLATANNIPNANIIYPGQVLTLPALGDLPAAGTQARAVRAAAEVKTSYDKSKGKFTFTPGEAIAELGRAKIDQLLKGKAAGK